MKMLACCANIVVVQKRFTILYCTSTVKTLIPTVDIRCAVRNKEKQCVAFISCARRLALTFLFLYLRKLFKALLDRVISFETRVFSFWKRRQLDAIDDGDWGLSTDVVVASYSDVPVTGNVLASGDSQPDPQLDLSSANENAPPATGNPSSTDQLQNALPPRPLPEKENNGFKT